MISSRRISQMARKWMRAAAAGRKRIAFQMRGAGAAVALDSEACTAGAPARKGCFVVYSNDGQRFEVPVTHLKTDIFGELFRISEDVFGLPGAGPITLACDAAFMASVLTCLRRRSSLDAERALLASMAVRSCSESWAPCSSLLQNNLQPLVLCGC